MNRRHSIRPWLGAATALLFVFLYAPLAAVVAGSFNAARYGTAWGGFTWQWYRVAWKNPLALAALRNTLILAGASTLLATVLGTMLGVGLSRGAFPGRKLAGWLAYGPVVMPDIVMAVALLMFFALVQERTGLLEMGLTTMILGHVTIQIPFVALVVRARLAGLDPALEEAARDLGATGWQSFWHVTFPLALPGIVAGALLAFTLSLDDFVVSFFTKGAGSDTLPILIYSSVKRGLTPDLNALSTVMILASVVATVMVTALQRGPGAPARR